MRVRVLASAADYTFAEGDCLLLCVKSLDVAAAVAPLDRRLPIVCFQNGVSAEPAAADSLEHVYGAMTWIPALHLEPGVVQVFSHDPAGRFRLGAFPVGEDERIRAVARDLVQAGFEAASVPDVMRWKHSKLLLNLGNAVDAFGVPDPGFPELVQRAVEEGRACLRAAPIDFLPTEELLSAMQAGEQPAQAIAGQARQGGSTWQSASRGQPLETEFLNGWIVQQGLQLGLPTPVNRALAYLSKVATAPRSVAVEQVLRWVEEK
jgi:2-dehydropantoate 2-reductase